MSRLLSVRRSKLTLGQAELETDKEKFPKEWVNSVKKRVNELKRTSIDRIDRLTLREVLGGEDISFDHQNDSLTENSLEANNHALRRATMEVSRGIELGTNVTTNLAAHNEKLRKALGTNVEIAGDLSLGTGLISDLEKRKRWEKNLCKIVFLSAAGIVVGFILLRYYWRK